MMKVTFAKADLPKGGAVAVFAYEGGKLTPPAQSLDKLLNGGLARAVKAAKFTGKAEQSLKLVSPGDGAFDEVIVIGLGRAAALNAQKMERIGGVTAGLLSRFAQAAAVVELSDARVKTPAEDLVAHFAYGALLARYRFDKYRTREKDDEKPKLSKLTVAAPEFAAARKVFAGLEAVAEGVFLTRDLVTEPANVLTPKSFAAECRKLKDLGLEIDVLDEKDMKKLGMGALLGVAQGSANEPALVVMEWKGADKKADTVAFIGKGVCFDSGGLSLKPASGMEEMKWDMGGAGAVTGLMAALAKRKAAVNAVGLIGLVENMPSATAQRPGDVVTSASGQTVEVLNTDAEGRLVLADVFWYAQDKFKPHTMIDLATLTGAIIVSLGSEYAGMFSNDDGLATALEKAGATVEEKVWRMPLGDAYDQQLKSEIADMKNIGGREAGSITAAQFLQRFVDAGVKWAHLDIAGTAWSKKDHPLVPRGGTGYGVRLLDRYVRDVWEKATPKDGAAVRSARPSAAAVAASGTARPAARKAAAKGAAKTARPKRKKKA